MKLFVLIGMCMAMSASLAGFAQSALVGTWKGTQNNLPVVDVTVKEDAGKVSGTVTFYMILHKPDGSDAHVGGNAEAPMENIKGDEKQIAFDLHRKDGSNVSFRVEYRGHDEARLFRTTNPLQGDQGLKMVRVR